MNTRHLLLLIAGLLLCTSVHAADELVRFDFEDGTLQGWTVETGEAGKLPTGPETARPDVRFNQQGRYFIGLYENPAHDEAAIVLRSPAFAIKSGTMSLLVGGGNHRDLCYVALYRAADDTEVYRETGTNSESMTRRYWDVSAFKGQQVYLKIVDAHTGGWGHINADDIRELTPEEEHARAAEIAGKQKSYQDWLATVDAPAKRIVYTGDALKDIAMPLGGVGAGHVSICGDGAVRQFCMFGKFTEGCVLPNSFFAIRTKSMTKAVQAKLLQQTPIENLPAIRKVEFIGEYPIAEVQFLDPDMPVLVTLRAFSPFIPTNAKDSGIPAAVFEFTIRNTSAEPVEVALLGTLQNAAGYDAQSGVAGVWNRCYGGNVNEPTAAGRVRGVLMSNPTLAKDAPYFGTMALAAIDRNAQVTTQWSNLRSLWTEFCTGGSAGQSQQGPSTGGSTWNAAVVVPFELRPGQSVTVPFVWAWHFPNYFVWWGREKGDRLGRMYANWFPDAWKAAEYVSSNYSRLAGDTEKFRRTFYKTSLPYWMLDRIGAQSSTLASTVCMWLEDGSFCGFEGGGCCPMNCAHVYNYEQQIAHLFPELDRIMRRIDLEVQQMPSGAVHHRTILPLSATRGSGAFCDGQLGTILKAYREYRMSADQTWLDKMWPRIKLAMEFVLNEWDPNRDGVLVHEQWNTYDAAMYGPNTFIGTLYLAALGASEEMAKIEGDTDFAKRVRAIYESGTNRLDEACWNGEYYWQIEAKPTPEQVGSMTWLLEDWPVASDKPNVNRPYGKGCHADQLLGQWWAYILDLGYLLPQDRVRSSLDSIMKHNWVKDFGEVPQTPRAFASAGDPGLYNCTWPRGGKPQHETLYSFEVWTGIEYEVASLMLREGRIRDAFQIVKAASDRYNGVPRAPIARNPWAEVECSNHYARAMAAWSILLATQGVNYCGPEGYLEFNPVTTPDHHTSFFTGAKSWGLFTQERGRNSQTNTLEVEYGKLQLKTFVVHLPNADLEDVRVRVAGTPGKPVCAADGDEVRVAFAEPVEIAAGKRLRVESTW